MSFKPWAFRIYKTHTSGELESFYNESRPLGFFTKSGERFEYNIQNQYERLDESFELTDSISIPAGKYWMLRQELQAGTFEGRRVWAEASYNWGEFYSGHISTLETSLGINASHHLNFRTDYIYNNIKTPQGNTVTNELAEYINYAFNPKLDLSFFIQWNSLDDLLFGNLRLHWIPRVGEDLYVVYNRGYDKLQPLKLSEPSSQSAAVKLVWRFVF